MRQYHRPAGSALCVCIGMIALLGGARGSIASGASLTMLYDFDSTDDRGAAGKLVLGTDGSFYGMELAYDGSVAFRITPSGEFSEIRSFYDPKFEGIASDLTRGKDGEFYGEANDSDTEECEWPRGCDYLFRLDRNGSLTVLYSFDSPNPPPPLKDRQPSLNTGLAEDRDGNIYGVADRKSAPYAPVIFELTSKGRPLPVATMEECKSFPHVSPLLLARDGTLYGTYSCGIEKPHDTIFRVSPTGVLSILHVFGPGEGTNPGALIQGRDANLYGMTKAGAKAGSHCDKDGCGTVFKIDTVSGKLTTLHEFTGGGDGSNPEIGPLLQADGTEMYGTACNGGPSGNLGIIFKIDTAGRLTTMYSLKPGDGVCPFGQLIPGPDGHLYGTTVGTIFRLNLDSRSRFPTLERRPAGSGKRPEHKE